MTEQKKKKKKMPYQNWLIPGLIGLVFLAGIGFVVKILLSPDGPHTKQQVSTVTLLKPPPPEVKEKPPEPEVPKEAPKQSIETPVEVPQQNQAQDQAQDNTPAGSDLGVDGEGGAGSDGFGLVGKKGGKALTLGGGGGGGGTMSQMARFGWYAQKVQAALSAQMKKQLEEQGGIPKGKFHAMVKIFLSESGVVTDYRILTPSGNSRVDSALKEAFVVVKRFDPIPDGMRKIMTIKVSSQG
jgi:periplasmic protein TonB